MSRVLCLVAFFCLISMVAADTIIFQQSYSDQKCTTKVGIPAQIGNASVIIPGNYGGSWIWNCQGDAKRIFQETFTDAAATKLVRIDEQSTACLIAGAGSTQLSCTVSTGGPAPVTFPPSDDWSISTLYMWNNGTGLAPYCDTVGTYTVQSASASGEQHCVPSGFDGKTVTRSSASFCSPNHQYGGAAWYSSKDCSGNAIKFSLSPAAGTCDQGVRSTCGGSSAQFPSSMPDEGIVNYDTKTDKFCQGSFTSASLYAEATCVPTGPSTSEKFTCSGVKYNTTLDGAKLQTFNTVDCTGATITENVQWAVNFDPTHPPTNCMNSDVYTCAFQFGAASSTVVSAISMIVAVFVALVASKQL